MSHISIVVPTYNDREYLEDSIGSVLDQTYDDIECVVVDGGSTDGSREFLESIDDDRFIIHFRESPQGLANARNFALEFASGEYVLFLDADDCLLPTATETLVSRLSEQPAECVGACSAFWDVWNEDTRTRRGVPDGKITIDDIMGENVIGGPTGTMLRRSVLDDVSGFDESFDSREDYDLYLRILSGEHWMLGIDEVLFERYHHGGQMVADPELMLKGTERILSKHDDLLSNVARSNFHLSAANSHAKLGRPRAARAELRRSIHENPYRVRPYVIYLSLLFGSTGYSMLEDLNDAVRSIR